MGAIDFSSITPQEFVTWFAVKSLRLVKAWAEEYPIDFLYFGNV